MTDASTNELEKIITEQIRRFGPMSIADYMALCLLHPKHGYYMSHPALGTLGDFTTSPEISQMFGELLGLLLAQVWMDQGAPRRFYLVEPGPGRGTLMADILRATAKVPGFSAAAEVWLVEASPLMQKAQRDTLGAHGINWVRDIGEVPRDAPLFLIANEFFDALPVRQFVRAPKGWQERMVGLGTAGLCYGLAAPIPVETLEDQSLGFDIGDMTETCQPALALVGDIAARIATSGGVAVLIDYGSWGALGNTFQAVRAHKKADPLVAPGCADLSAHVDFSALSHAAKGVAVTSLVEQGALLERLGIDARSRVLAENLTGQALSSHLAAYRRLTRGDEMGSLFKAMALYPQGTALPPGFS